MSNIMADDGRVFITAEIGQNHNGDLGLALSLVDAAKRAGVDSVKFQARSPELCVPKHMWNVPKETPDGIMTYLKYREWLELSMNDYAEIDHYCRTIGLPWFVSVWDTSSYVRMKEAFPEMPAWKIPSAMLTNTELLQNIGGSLGRQGKTTPVILATGMSTPAQIDRAFGLLNVHVSNIVLAHCNSTYPCPNDQVNLRVMQALFAEFPHATVGYSAHTTGLAPSVAAVALGAKYLEFHLTLDRSMWGSDQAASIEPTGAARLVKDARVVESAMGDGEKRVTEAEAEAMRRLRG
jgi:N-acetylneuraminate synthase